LPSARITIREEQDGDAAAIRRVVQEAFGGLAEADLVDALRTHGKFKLSLVAVLEGQVAGHLLLTEATIESTGSCLKALGLAHWR
jgi:putative acetyltransferase